MAEPQPFYSISGLEKFINRVIKGLFYYRLILVLLSLIGISFLLVSVWNSSKQEDKLKNISYVFAAGSIIIGIFYTILNYEYNQIKSSHDRLLSKKILAFQICSEWSKPVMVENLKITNIMRIKNSNLIDDNRPTEFAKVLENDENTRSALVSIFNFLESVSLGVWDEIMDEYLIRKYFRTVFISYYMDYNFFIEFRRSLHQNPEIWVQFTNLAQKWIKENKH